MENNTNVENQDNSQTAETPRREFFRAGAKAAYMIPAVLIAMKATERPALAASGPQQF